MIQAKTCPTDSALQRYAEGWSDPTSTLAVEEHLSLCPACEERLNTIETARASDGLIEALRLRGQWNSEYEPNNSNPPQTAIHSSDSVDSGFRQVLAEIQEWPLDAVPSATSQADLPRSLGQYELLELIGQGGMAQVYRARHSKLQRTVAIKLLNVPKWQVDRSLARLEREIAVVGQLHHPAIVAATDAGQYEDTPYLVTEFIDGLNLSQLARSVQFGDSLCDPTEVSDAIHNSHTANVCEAIRVAALGLAHAHAQGVTHRDIKPSNLMINRQGQVKILDFGLVHLEGWQDEALELTTVGQLLGTLDYMAPEQADKATSVDHRSDVYALGASLFRLLCGRAPYAASLYQSPLEKLRLLAMTDPPRVETLRPDLPIELAELINQTLSRDPAKRPPSAAHLAEALSPYCDGHRLGAWVESAIANPPSPLPNQPRDSASLFKRREAIGELAPAPTTKPSGVGRRWWPWLLTTAAGAAAIWLSIILILDTQKGALVIESESADVRVTLRKDGQESETLQLEPGLNQTRVFAGTYQIEIDGPADAYQLDRNSVVIKRGEVVLAKVSRKPLLDSPSATPFGHSANSSDGPAPTLGDEPTYKGHPFSHWATVFRTEREPSIRIEAFKNMGFLPGDRVPLLVEVIIASNRGPRQYLDAILVDQSGMDLSKDHWMQIEDSIKNSEAATHVDSIIQLSRMIRFSRVDADGRTISNSNLVEFLEKVAKLTNEFAPAWPPESRSELIDRLSKWLPFFPVEGDELQMKIVNIISNCLRAGNIDRKRWIRLANEDFIQANSGLRTLAIEALLGSSDPPFSTAPENIYGLIAAASLMEQDSDLRATFFQRVDGTLKAASTVELRALVPEVDRSSGNTLRFYRSNDATNGGELDKLLPEGISLSGGKAAFTPAKFSFNVAGDQVLLAQVNTNATVGELLIGLWMLLANDQDMAESSIVDELLKQTQAEHDVFVEQLRKQLPSNFRQATVQFGLEGATIERRAYDNDGKSVRRKKVFFGIPIQEVPEGSFSRLVDQIWNRLDFDRSTLVPIGTEQGPIKFSAEMDFDRDQKVSWEELYQYLFGQHPAVALEGITPEIAHGILLHRHILTLLGRPQAEIDFGDPKLEREAPSEQAVDEPSNGDSNTSETNRVSTSDAESSERHEMKSDEEHSLEPKQNLEHDEPVFSGITHAEWLRRFRVETNPNEKLNAFKALVSFKNANLVESTRSVLLEYLASGGTDEMIISEVDAIGGIGSDHWKQLPDIVAKLPMTARAKLVHELRGLARPVEDYSRRNNPKTPTTSARVLPYLDFFENQLAECGANWSSEERSTVLIGVLDLVRQRYRNAEEQRIVEARFFEITENTAFDHRCWYAVRNDSFWEKHVAVRVKLDAAVIQSIPTTFEVNIETLESLLSLHSIHSRCSNEQKTTITKKLDQLMQSINADHFRMKSAYFQLNRLNGYSAELFELPDQEIRRYASTSAGPPKPKTDWEIGAEQFLAYYFYQQPSRGRNSFCLQVSIPNALQNVIGARKIWLYDSKQPNYTSHHLIDCLVVTYVRFLPETENYQPPSSIVHLEKIVAELFEPLAKNLASFGEPGQHLVVRSYWRDPESESRIIWRLDKSSDESIVMSREQLAALMVSSSVASALRGEQPVGPIWPEESGPALLRRLSKQSGPKLTESRDEPKTEDSGEKDHEPQPPTPESTKHKSVETSCPYTTLADTAL